MTAKKKPVTKKATEPKKEKLTPAMIRFVYLYLGGGDGTCWNNATRSYFFAYNGEDALIKDAKGEYTKEYRTALTEGPALLGKPRIQKYKDELLTSIGYDPENIKKRFAELSGQNHNLPVALQATDRMAKVAGLLSDDKKVNIPELEALGQAIKSILGA